MSDVDDLQALEARRCAAIAAGDTETLSALLTDDYSHVHMTGALDDRAGHLRAISGRPRQAIRGDLTIRVYGDLAVITGLQTNRTPNPSGGPPTEIQAYCHQVAVRQDGAWRFASVQLTPMNA